MAVFVIEHRDGGKWYATWGWVGQPESALRFNAAEDAQSVIDGTGPAREGEVKTIEMREDAKGSPAHGTRTDYNPFGFPTNV